jgi:hypothetical protein
LRAVSTAVDGNGLPMLAVFIVANLNQTAKATNLSRRTVYRIKDVPAAAEAALATWGA